MNSTQRHRTRSYQNPSSNHRRQPCKGIWGGNQYYDNNRSNNDDYQELFQYCIWWRVRIQHQRKEEGEEPFNHLFHTFSISCACGIHSNCACGIHNICVCDHTFLYLTFYSFFTRLCVRGGSLYKGLVHDGLACINLFTNAQ